MSAADPQVAELVEVRLIGLPPAEHLATQEHIDGLMREFALIAQSEGQDPGTTPARVLHLVERARARYGRFTAAPREEIENAAARGAGAVDVTYRVPPSVAQVADELGALLEEADEFCRDGALLTLAAPPEVARYRRWFLGEFRRQINGSPPQGYRRS